MHGDAERRHDVAGRWRERRDGGGVQRDQRGGDQRYVDGGLQVYAVGGERVHGQAVENPTSQKRDVGHPAHSPRLEIST